MIFNINQTAILSHSTVDGEIHRYSRDISIDRSLIDEKNIMTRSIDRAFFRGWSETRSSSHRQRGWRAKKRPRRRKKRSRISERTTLPPDRVNYGTISSGRYISSRLGEPGPGGGITALLSLRLLLSTLSRILSSLPDSLQLA